ncbi:hypothetical protein MKY41_14950 [Sporosarcina sp. FSL W7-1349]|uniref:hypothetical protein n=1 Tax=Sporosarcina sp. FSL W7-1349 TaxID=2921561 RepID=UPI0030F6B93F
MTEKFQVETNVEDRREARFTGIPEAKEFPDLEPKQNAEKQRKQYENTVGELERNRTSSD